MKKEVYIMKDLLNTILSLGLGTLAMTKEKAEEIVDELIKQGNIGREEGTNLVSELIKKGEKSEAEIKMRIEKILHDMLAKIDVPTRKEITELRTEIDQLKKVLSKKKVSKEGG